MGRLDGRLGGARRGRVGRDGGDRTCRRAGSVRPKGSHHAEAEAEVPRVRVIAATIGAAENARRGITPRAAAEHTRLPGIWTSRILNRRFGVIARVEPIRAPLPNVSMHVEKAKGVPPPLADRPGLAIRGRAPRGVVAENGCVAAKTVTRGAAGAAGVLPFRLRRQAIQGAHRFLFGQFTEPAAELHGIVPTHVIDGTVGIAPELARVIAHHALVFRLGYLVATELERFGYLDVMASALARRRSKYHAGAPAD